MNKRFMVGFSFLAVLLIGGFLIGDFNNSGTIPVVASGEATVKEESISLQGLITSEGEQEILEYGFNWGTSSDLGQTKLVDSIRNNTYQITINDLTPGKTYFYQAYAVNNKGTGYGEVKEVTVPMPPDELPAIVMVNPEENPDINSEKVNIAAVTEDKKETNQSPKLEAPNNTPQPSRGAVWVAASNKYPHLSKVNGAFGQFPYREIGGGRIEIDPEWVQENIVTITLPGLNQKVEVHKEAAANFMAAFNYIENGTAYINGQEVPLLSLIKTMDGTFVPRHINWDSSRGLSNHSWGTAIDINAAGHFRYVDPNKEPNNPNLILWEKAFKPAGFSWGNSYSDAMHYEIFK